MGEGGWGRSEGDRVSVRSEGLQVRGGYRDAQGSADRNKGGQVETGRACGAMRGQAPHRAAQSGTGRHREAQGGTERHREAQGDTGRHRETQRGTGRHREAQGGMRGIIEAQRGTGREKEL